MILPRVLKNKYNYVVMKNLLLTVNYRALYVFYSKLVDFLKTQIYLQIGTQIDITINTICNAADNSWTR